MGELRPVIVLVEDDKELAQMYEEMFKREKFIVVLAYDGEEAVPKINQENPDVILLDLMLPRRGGLGVLQIIKSMPQTKNIPVVILTAHPQEEYKKMAIHYGIAGFISKSEMMPAQVVEKVKQIIGWK